MQQIVTLHLFLPFDLKIYFFSNQQFLMLSGNLTRVFHEATFNIFLDLKNDIFVFFQMSALRTTLLTVSKTSKGLKILFEDWKLSEDEGCLINFILCFMSLLTAPVFKNSNFLAKISFISLRKGLKSNFQRLSIPNVDLSEKIGKVVIK